MDINQQNKLMSQLLVSEAVSFPTSPNKLKKLKPKYIDPNFIASASRVASQVDSADY
jgi:hypothetical protein